MSIATKDGMIAGVERKASGKGRDCKFFDTGMKTVYGGCG
jgi:hypothetical protein